MNEVFNAEFQGKMPYKPYCTNSLPAGLFVRPRSIALTHSYIQINPPHMKGALVFDVDWPVSCFVADDLGLPYPTFFVQNMDNGHAHLIYSLKAPVCTSDNAQLKPLRYAAAVEGAYQRRLGADPMYSGLIAKNPFSSTWEVFSYKGRRVFSLDDLAAAVRGDLGAVRRPCRKAAFGLWRNCTVFEEVSKWAYKAVRQYWEPGRIGGDWEGAVLSRCGELNGEFPAPLPPGELRCTARSIARWVWRRFSPEGLSEWQRRQVGKRWAVSSHKAEGLELLREGLSVEEVSGALGVTPRAVRMWRQEAGLREASVTEREPWAALGISRRWYYRLLADGKLDDYKRRRYKAL